MNCYTMENIDKPEVCVSSHSQTCQIVEDELPPCPSASQTPESQSYHKKELIDVTQKPIIWVLGGPGTGKRTICLLAMAKYGFAHISPADLLREELTTDSDRAKCISAIVKRGGLVPTDLVLDLIREEVTRKQDIATGYLIDDYPRDNLQAIAFEQTLGIAAITLLLNAPISVMKKRLRAMAHPSEMAYIDATIEERIGHYFPTVQEVRRFPRLHIINTEGSIAVVFEAVKRLLDPIVGAIRTAPDAPINVSLSKKEEEARVKEVVDTYLALRFK